LFVIIFILLFLLFAFHRSVPQSERHRFLKVPFAPQSPKKSLIAASLRAAAIFVYC